MSHLPAIYPDVQEQHGRPGMGRTTRTLKWL
jgi:hypothetical protein